MIGEKVGRDKSKVFPGCGSTANFSEEQLTILSKLHNITLNVKGEDLLINISKLLKETKKLKEVVNVLGEKSILVFRRELSLLLEEECERTNKSVYCKVSELWEKQDIIIKKMSLGIEVERKLDTINENEVTITTKSALAISLRKKIRIIFEAKREKLIGIDKTIRELIDKQNAEKIIQEKEQRQKDRFILEKIYNQIIDNLYGDNDREDMKKISTIEDKKLFTLREKILNNITTLLKIEKEFKKSSIDNINTNINYWRGPENLGKLNTKLKKQKKRLSYNIKSQKDSSNMELKIRNTRQDIEKLKDEISFALYEKDMLIQNLKELKILEAKYKLLVSTQSQEEQ